MRCISCFPFLLTSTIHYLGGSFSDLSHNVNSFTASAESSSGSLGAYSNIQALSHGSPHTALTLPCLLMPPPSHLCHLLPPYTPATALLSSRTASLLLLLELRTLLLPLPGTLSPDLYVVWSLTPFSSCSNVLYQGGLSELW